jgi:hypothetical protein
MTMFKTQFSFAQWPLIIILLIQLVACGRDKEEIKLKPEIDDTTALVGSGISNCIDSLNITPFAGGCLNIFLYSYLSDSVFLTLKINPEIVDITDTCLVYNFPKDGLEVALEAKGSDPDSVYFNYCNDVIMDLGTTTIYQATSGTMRIVSDRAHISDTSRSFRLSVILKDIEFIQLDTIINQIKYYNFPLGWYPPNCC